MATKKRPVAAQKAVRPAAPKPSKAAPKAKSKSAARTRAVAKPARPAATKPAPRTPVAKAIAKPAKAKPIAKSPANGKSAAAPKSQVHTAAPTVTSRTLARKSTPVLLVEAIEPVLTFWARVGFKATVEVPGAKGLGFVILSNGEIEVMYQTWSALKDDLPELGARAAHPDKAFLFVEVNDLDAVANAMERHPVFMPRRETFYGSTEIGFRDPAGHYVTFAQFKA